MADPEDSFVQRIYEVCHSAPLEGAGGSLPSFAVRDHRHGRRDLMAVQVARDSPPRPLPLTTLSGQQIPNLLLPIAFGNAAGGPYGGGEAQYVIMPTPPGPAILSAAFTPWSERALIDLLLRPAAIALDLLGQLGITHRAIRGNNVFQAPGGASCTLGGAWAAPAASLQPALFEPPYSAMCHPAGRGDGTMADDVYALGILLICLAIGSMPMAECGADEVIRRKLERGSFAAVVGSHRLPPSIADLARGMLAEEPSHRPAPVLLADPLSARSRRVAARPPQRAQTPLELDGVAAWDARMLALALSRSPDQGLRLLRGAEIDPWLRRALGDPVLAARVDDEVRGAKSTHASEIPSADSMLLLRCIALLDPLAPACWRGIALFPDGIGPLAASAGSEGGSQGQVRLREAITSFILSEAAVAWANSQGERAELAMLRLDSRQNRVLLNIPGWAGGFARLRYGLNPLLACNSPLLGTASVGRLSDLLPALERHATQLATSKGVLLVDVDIAAFISARLKGRMDAEFSVLAQAEAPEIDPPGHRGLAQLRVLARLADHDPAQPWPMLAAASLHSAEAATSCWRSAALRENRVAQLREAAARGALTAMLGILEDRTSLQADAGAARAAEMEIARLDRLLDQFSAQREVRRSMARVTAQEITTAVGVMLLVAVAVGQAILGP